MVRHGETDWNAQGRLQGRIDIPLNVRGILQAEECSEFLKESQWDVLISSPLIRAKQTSEIINKKLDFPLIEMEVFAERHFGEAEGMLLQERNTAFPDGVYPNQEDYSAFNKRVMAGIKEISRNFIDKKILLVAHGAVINTILATLSNREVGSGKTNLLNACISNIYVQQEQWKIRDFNQVAHLSDYREKH